MPRPLNHPVLTDETIWSHLPKGLGDRITPGTVPGLYLQRSTSTDPVRVARTGEYIWHIRTYRVGFEGTPRRRIGVFPDMSLSEASAEAEKFLRDGEERWRISQAQKKLASEPKPALKPALKPASTPASASLDDAKAAAKAAYEEALKAALVAEAAARAKADAKAMIAKLFGDKDEPASKEV